MGRFKFLSSKRDTEGIGEIGKALLINGVIIDYQISAGTAFLTIDCHGKKVRIAVKEHVLKSKKFKMIKDFPVIVTGHELEEGETISHVIFDPDGMKKLEYAQYFKKDKNLDPGAFLDRRVHNSYMAVKREDYPDDFIGQRWEIIEVSGQVIFKAMFSDPCEELFGDDYSSHIHLLRIRLNDGKYVSIYCTENLYNQYELGDMTGTIRAKASSFIYNFTIRKRHTVAHEE